MTAAPVLQIEGLTVCYRSGRRLLPAVQQFDLTLDAGEAYGLVGESGCGKSTVAFGVMGHLPENGCLTAGRILVNGENVVGLDEPGLRRLRSEEHTSELQSLMRISYAVFCLKKKNKQNKEVNKHTSINT